MKIVIEQIRDTAGTVIAEHCFMTDEHFRITHPYLTGEFCNPVEFIAMLAKDSELRELAGWHKSTTHPVKGETATLWQVLLDHTDSEHGEPRLKALQLSKGQTADEVNIP